MTGWTLFPATPLPPKDLVVRCDFWTSAWLYLLPNQFSCCVVASLLIIMVLKLQLDKDGNVAARPSDWTEALPHPDETEFICIVAGNSNLAWALHDGRQDGFAPRLFWR